MLLAFDQFWTTLPWARGYYILGCLSWDLGTWYRLSNTIVTLTYIIKLLVVLISLVFRHWITEACLNSVYILTHNKYMQVLFIVLWVNLALLFILGRWRVSQETKTRQWFYRTRSGFLTSIFLCVLGKKLPHSTLLHDSVAYFTMHIFPSLWQSNVYIIMYHPETR